MESNKSTASSGGVGLLGLVFVAFLVMKLAKVGAVADWSWWWVTAPLWGGFALVCAIFIVAFVVLVVRDIVTPKRKRQP